MTLNGGITTNALVGPALGVNYALNRLYAVQNTISGLGLENFYSHWTDDGTTWNTHSPENLIDTGYWANCPPGERADGAQEACVYFSEVYGQKLLFKGYYSSRHLGSVPLDTVGGNPSGCGWNNWNAETTKFNVGSAHNNAALVVGWVPNTSEQPISTRYWDNWRGFGGDRFNIGGYWLADITSNDGPSCALSPAGPVIPDHIALAWRGKSDTYIRVYLNNISTASIIRLTDWSQNTPAIAFFNNKIFLAWRGGDNRITVAWLDLWN